MLINPKGTTNSEEHEKVMREKGFDRHTASAYLIALKGLGMLNDIKWHKIHGLSETVDNGVGIITGDKDLTLVARKLGVEIIW